MAIDKTKEKYMPLLLADSYQEKDAKSALDKIFDCAAKAVTKFC